MRQSLLLFTLHFFTLALVACDGGSNDVDPSTLPSTLGGEREASVHLPRELARDREYPLVVLLHGYSASGQLQDLYLGISSLVSEYEFILVIPDGTVEDSSAGNRFWNATDACCNFHGSTVDDVVYLSGLIDEALEELPIDAGRVYLFGHSNGGFMSYRMACDTPERITAIASLAGATFKDPSDCDPSEPVSVLQIHGTDDATIPYEGNETMPSALESVEFWAAETGCDLGAARVGERLDLDDTLEGDDTDALYFEEGCAAGFDHGLYSIIDGSHLPTSTRSKNLSRRTLEWLLRHEKR